jgi:hypothetical protein
MVSPARAGQRCGEWEVSGRPDLLKEAAGIDPFRRGLSHHILPDLMAITFMVTI